MTRAMENENAGSSRLVMRLYHGRTWTAPHGDIQSGLATSESVSISDRPPPDLDLSWHN